MMALHSLVPASIGTLSPIAAARSQAITFSHASHPIRGLPVCAPSESWGAVHRLPAISAQIAKSPRLVASAARLSQHAQGDTDAELESQEMRDARSADEAEEARQVAGYREVVEKMKALPEKEVNAARKLVASWLKAGSAIEEMVVKAGAEGKLNTTVLAVISNRLEVARQDEETDAMEALDLVYRRVETEMQYLAASPAMRLLHELLQLWLSEGQGDEKQWLEACEERMRGAFASEHAFMFYMPGGVDPSEHRGPIDMPSGAAEEEDEELFRGDFLREVKDLLLELDAEAMAPVEGWDARAVALRLRVQQKATARNRIRKLYRLAASLKN